MKTVINKRRVFYISGFDPRGATAYHRMFCDESQKLAMRQGLELRVGNRQRESELSTVWRAERQTAHGTVESTFEFLHWDDLVRKHWHSGIRKLYGLLPAVYRDMLLRAKLLGKVWPVSRWPVFTGFVPAMVFLGIPAVAGLAAWIAYTLSIIMFPQVNFLPPIAAILGFSVIAAAGIWLERVLAVGWLLRTYAFVMGYGFGRIPEFEPRLEMFAERILQYVRDSDDDEIIVVGHSVGANVAVSALARALQRSPGLWRDHVPVSFLTLGGSIPMLGLMPSAGVFRSELAALADSLELEWVDISAYEDGASFPLVNPVVATGLVAGGGIRPQVLSGGFKDMLMPRTYYVAVWDLFRMHFQYLMASERDVPNDYLTLTTDHLPFRQRFGHSQD
jgi:hypothetical protein